MSIASKRDAGFRSRTAYGGKGTATAGGTGDNTAVNTPWIDRNLMTGVPDSAKYVAVMDGAITNGQSLSMRFKLQDADDSSGTGAADVVDSLQVTDTGVQANQLTATGQATAEVDVSLVKCRRYVRMVVTPDLTAANTDTLTWYGLWVFFGGDRGPITRSPI